MASPFETTPPPTTKTPAQTKAEKQKFLADTPSNIQTLSDIIKSQEAQVQTLDQAAADAVAAGDTATARSERAFSEAGYNLDPRIRAAQGFQAEREFSETAAALRQQAADKQLQLSQQAEESRQSMLANQSTLREQIEEEDTLETANALSTADGIITKYYEAGQEWPMYQEAWQQSADMSPNAFEAFWTNIQSSYGELGGDHSSPMAHPLVQYNLQVGNPPLQGLTPRDTEEGGYKYDAYAKGRDLLAELNVPEGATYDEELGTYVYEMPKDGSAPLAVFPTEEA